MIKKTLARSFTFIFLTGVGFLAGGILGPILMVWDKYPNQNTFESKSELLKRQLIQVRSGRDFNWTQNLADLGSEDKFILSALHQLKVTELDATEYLYNYFEKGGLPGGYIDIFDSDTAIFVNGLGDLALLNLSNLSLKKLESNLSDIVESQNYQGIIIPDLQGRFGLRDILVARGKIYISLFLDVTGDGCYGLGILESSVADIKFNLPPFEQKFVTDECNRNFNGHASGGRMKFLNNELIFKIFFLYFILKKFEIIKFKIKKLKIKYYKDYKENLNMFAYTCFNNGSHFGYTNSQLKSGICKYFRRNEKEKLLWCISELGLFSKLENKEMRKLNYCSKK